MSVCTLFVPVYVTGASSRSLLLPLHTIIQPQAIGQSKSPKPLFLSFLCKPPLKQAKRKGGATTLLFRKPGLTDPLLLHRGPTQQQQASGSPFWRCPPPRSTSSSASRRQPRGKGAQHGRCLPLPPLPPLRQRATSAFCWGLPTVPWPSSSSPSKASFFKFQKGWGRGGWGYGSC